MKMKMLMAIITVGFMLAGALFALAQAPAQHPPRVPAAPSAAAPAAPPAEAHFQKQIDNIKV